MSDLQFNKQFFFQISWAIMLNRNGFTSILRQPIFVWNSENKTVDIPVQGVYYVSLTVCMYELDWTDIAGVKSELGNWIIEINLPGRLSLLDEKFDYTSATVQKSKILFFSLTNKLRVIIPTNLKQYVIHFVGFLI